MKHSARPGVGGRRGGDDYILNGSKTFITGGYNADRVLVVARTSPADPDNRRTGPSILVVDTTSPGFEVGRLLEKMGLKAQDTCELSFSDVRVPDADLLGSEVASFQNTKFVLADCAADVARVVDKCLQLHGGYGYMSEYPISRLYANARVSRIYGGTSGVMRSIVARSLGL